MAFILEDSFLNSGVKIVKKVEISYSVPAEQSTEPMIEELYSFSLARGKCQTHSYLSNYLEV